MKVTLVCNSDINGGAAVVTKRLANALRQEGVDARMLVCTKLSDDPQVRVVSSRSGRSFAFLKERLGIFMANGFTETDLFKVSTADSGLNIASHPWIQDADVVVLSWVNQGMLSLKGVRKIAALGKPVVWVMHDMWNLTGICHHAYECTRYREECGCCPFLHSKSPRDLSHKVWLRKNELYRSTPLHFVAVSNWLAEKCRESSLMRDMPVSVIHNAFPVDSFYTEPHHEVQLSSIDYSRNIILMGAARLDHPIKGLDYAIDALNEIFMNRPEVAHTSMALFFGNVKDPSVLDRLNFPFQLFGTVNDPKVLREIYAASKVVLSTSLYETLPGTLIEGQAAGCIPVTFGEGGQSDIVDHLHSGYIAAYKDSHDVAKGILWALEAPLEREALRRQVRERFSAKTIARQYLDLFDTLLARNDHK